MTISVTTLIRSMPADLSKDVERFQPRICKLAKIAAEATGEREEDIIQDFLEKLLVANGRFRHQSQRTTFIVAVVRNLAFSMMRTARRRKPYLPTDLADLTVDPATANDHTHRSFMLKKASEYMAENWPPGAIRKLISEEGNPAELAARYGLPV